MRTYIRSRSRGVELIELALITPFLVSALLAIFDVTNIIRTNMAIGEAASIASTQLRALDTQRVEWTGSDPRIVRATESAERELSSVLPRARFDCGEALDPHCASVVIEPDLAADAPTVRVHMQYALPVLIVGTEPRVLSRTIERRLESTYLPRGETQVGNADMMEEDGED